MFERTSFRILLSFVLAAPTSISFGSTQRLINGSPVEEGTFQEVVRIKTGGSGCTATVVGPRVIVTAAHCANTGSVSKFMVGGVQYDAKMTRSSLYPRQDHDICIGVTDEEITGVKPASIGGSAEKGTRITLLGYGCTKPGGSGGNDGVLRVGETEVISFKNFDMVMKQSGGAALCYGDSGGPAFVIEEGKHLLLGINSKGNIRDTSYDTRTDVEESKALFQKFTEDQGVEICGVNLECAAGE